MSNLLVLIGAGQNFHEKGSQFIPDTSPKETVLHVVDLGIHDHIDKLDAHLKKWHKDNTFFKMSFEKYMQEHFSKHAENFKHILFLTYTVEFGYPVRDYIFLNLCHSGSYIDNTLIEELFTYLDENIDDLSILVRFSNYLSDLRQKIVSLRDTTGIYDFLRLAEVTASLQTKENDIKPTIFNRIIQDIIRFYNEEIDVIHECLAWLKRNNLTLDLLYTVDGQIQFTEVVKSKDNFDAIQFASQGYNKFLVYWVQHGKIPAETNFEKK